MNVNIRVAHKQDCPRLLELITELAIYEKAPDEVTVSLQEFEDAGFGNKPVWKAFVAEIDGLVIGFALYYIRYSTWKGSRLYFERIITEAREMGLSGMVWQVLDWNEPAINFYNKYKANIEAGWLNASLSKEQILNL
jgi:N-acetylglutamate synthase-like GNAT family acetyltransferase